MRVEELQFVLGEGTALLDQRADLAIGTDADLDEGGYRLELAQAQGMVMVQLGVSISEALVRIRAYAQEEDRRLAEVELRAATVRWPRVAAAGFQSVHAFPLRLRSQVIGAMNVFGDTKGGDFTEPDVPIMQALADVAAIGLLQERAIRRGEVLSEPLQGALNSRIVIEQAKGAVAQSEGVDVDEAFIIIRSYARRHNRKLTDVAHALVNDSAVLSQVLYS